MTPLTFSGSFTQQEPLSDEAVSAAVEVMRSGRLHRYNMAPGEIAPVARLEADYARWQGAQYCLATASGGQAMQIALRAAGVAPGDAVLTNAFTLAPVPGAIAAVSAEPVFVETTDALRIDLHDLAGKMKETGARFLMLSHMRGHICDMDRLMEICDANDVILLEDCAHTMGAKWRGVRSGNFGLAGCFSTQTYKHMNSGEGGFLTSNDPAFMARAIILSGSYMLFDRHGAAPSSEHFEVARYESPNTSARMDNLRAAILLPQLQGIEDSIVRWNDRYIAIEAELRSSNVITAIPRPQEESMVGSSIQFRVPDFSASDCKSFVELAASRGVELKWFGADAPHGFTSTHKSWRYAKSQEMPKSDEVLSTLFDMRLPLTFSVADCHVIGKIISACAGEIA